ncbi:MAG: Fe-S cluster assembly protein SufD [Candidatus Dormibacteraceae bacterium]
MPFSSESVEELSSLHGEPDWLRVRRREAWRVYEEIGLPRRDDEEWRRIDFKGFRFEDFTSFEEPNGGPPSDVIEGAAGVLRQRGSALGKVELDPAVAAKGVLFMPLSQAAREHPELVQRHLFSEVRADRDKFSAAHAALFSGGTLLYVPDNVEIERPFVGQFWSSGGGAAVLPHTLILAGRNARFNYLDEFLSPTLDAPAFTSGSAELFVGEGADVGYVAVQKWGRHAYQFANQRAHVQKDGAARIFNVTLGGRFAKLRVEANLQGRGSSAELKGIYLASEDQFFDFHTLQDHQVGDTRSDLLFKGALRDTARSVYAGLIRIEKGAARSDAYQANRNLVLSDKARATSIPMLEIDNNDVRCTHGATVGPVDPMHLFYLVSRGIPEPTAMRMLVQGFFGEVIDRIPFEQARRLVEDELEARLG